MDLQFFYEVCCSCAIVRRLIYAHCGEMSLLQRDEGLVGGGLALAQSLFMIKVADRRIDSRGVKRFMQIADTYSSVLMTTGDETIT